MNGIRKFFKGLRIFPVASTAVSEKGDIEVLDTGGKINYHNGTTASPVVTEAHASTLTNKTLVVANNTVTTAASGNLAATELNAALDELQTDIDTRALDADLDAHVDDAAGAHAASAISFSPTGTIAGSDVQTAVAEVASEAAAALASHESDTSTHGVGEIVGRTEAQTLTNKTLTSPVIGTIVTAASGDLNLTPNGTGVVKVESGSAKGLDVQSAGAMPIGASVGANDITLGGASSTVIIPGNLQIDGTTTSVNSTNLEVEDKNILVNNGGNDASSEGAGLTVERTGTNGSLIYKDASATKFALGALGSEVDVVGTSSTQTLSNKTIDNTNTIAVADGNFEVQHSGDDTIKIRLDAGGSTGTSTIIAASQTGNRTLNLPDANDTLVGKATTDTFTNKTISQNDNTLSGYTARAVITADSSGNLGNGVAPGSSGNVLTSDGTDWVSSTPSSAPSSSKDSSNLSFAAAVAANALTIALKDAGGSDPSGGSPVKIGFRHATSATGQYNQRSVTGALSVVISSGSTLGHKSAADHYIYVYAIDNAGTVELAVSTVIFDEGSVQSTTAEGGAGAADSNRILYSTTARANVPIRLIGRLKSNQATAGTWASAPTELSVGEFDKLPIYFHVTNTTQSVANNTSNIVFTSLVATVDPFNTISGGDRFIAPITGFYQFSQTNAYDSSSATFRIVEYKINGGTSIRTTACNGTGSTQTTLTGSWGVYLTAGDYIMFGVFQATGSAENCSLIGASGYLVR
jgi:hypothetical protein